jgi:transcription initiation factor IIE alpha subunit
MTARIAMDRYVLETLMRDLVGHDRKPSAFLLYLAVLQTADRGKALLSHAQLAEMTGLSKRATQDALAHLSRRGLMSIRRAGPTEPAQLQPLAPWRRGPTSTPGLRASLR